MTTATLNQRCTVVRPVRVQLGLREFEFEANYIEVCDGGSGAVHEVIVTNQPCSRMLHFFNLSNEQLFVYFAEWGVFKKNWAILEPGDNYLKMDSKLDETNCHFFTATEMGTLVDLKRGDNIKIKPPSGG